ncbi:condensation domain-containing protein [Pseudomonas aeruginosa]
MPLTPVQRRFFAEAIPQRNHWNQSLLLAPADSLEPVLLREALQAVVSRHDALRLRFDGVDERVAGGVRSCRVCGRCAMGASVG